MLQHVSALTDGHLQGDHMFFSMCSWWFNLFGRNSTYD